jgi:hypothetical protein
MTEVTDDDRRNSTPSVINKSPALLWNPSLMTDVTELFESLYTRDEMSYTYSVSYLSVTSVISPEYGNDNGSLAMTEGPKKFCHRSVILSFHYGIEGFTHEEVSHGER